MSSDLLTTRDAADEIGVNPQFMVARVNSGEIKALRLSRNAVRIRRVDFDAWLSTTSTDAA